MKQSEGAQFAPLNEDELETAWLQFLAVGRPVPEDEPEELERRQVYVESESPRSSHQREEGRQASSVPAMPEARITPVQPEDFEMPMRIPAGRGSKVGKRGPAG